MHRAPVRRVVDSAERRDERRGAVVHLGAVTMTDSEVLAELRRRLDRRIRPLLAHWPSSEADALIAKMARFEFKYEGRAALERRRGALESDGP